MSVTIEDVMHLAHAYASQEADGCASVSTSAYDDLYSALTALVAQARDEEAEACAEIAKSYGQAAQKLIQADKAMIARAIESAIRSKRGQSGVLARVMDQEAEACIAILASVGHDNPMTANDCIDLIRARIAGRKA